MPDRTIENRFNYLLGCLLENEIEADELRELETLVKTYPEFGDELKRQLSIDERLAHYENPSRSGDSFTRSLLATLDAQTDGEAFVQRVVDRADENSHTSRSDRAPWTVAAIAIAACITILITWFRSPTDTNAFPEPESRPEGVAVVSKLVGDLNQDALPKERGDTISKGKLELTAGFATLEFYSGARLSIAGPASLEMAGANRVICHYGKVRANVPYVAQGFTIATPESEIIDLGTEFGVDVDQAGKTEIHVFDGEVEAYDALGTPSSKVTLEAGLGLQIGSGGSRTDISAQNEKFSELTSIHNLEQNKSAKELTRWKTVNAAAKQDNRLIAYWDFEPDAGDERALRNRAPSGSNLDGAVIGANWTEGPWPGKKALSFKRPGDQVRVHVPDTFDNLSLAAWILIDGLDRRHSSLFLSDGWEPGEFHWQFRNDGLLNLGVNNDLRNPDGPYDEAQNHKSEPFVNLSRLGRWMHIATVMDQNNKTVTHYLNGRVLSSSTISRNVELKAGLSTIGNWNNPLSLKTSINPIRNLNGKIAELMLFSEALSHDEIRQLALQNQSSLTHLSH